MNPTRPAAAPRTRPRLAVRLLALTLSTVAGLGLAELVVGAARGWAFPYLNLYVADDDYGVRLEADASTHVRSREGRITAIRTNALGFRGPDWAPAVSDAPVPGRVLLLGDSQAFGYNVAEDDGMAAHLAAALGPGAEVLDAATPTWGPPEYLRALAELGPVYRPEVVVVVMNLANDWLEANIPNRRRSTAKDGWVAYRRPDEPAPEPNALRTFFLGRSHLVYAVRALIAGASDAPPTDAVTARRLLDNLTTIARPDGAYRSRLGRYATAARERCEALGCRVVIAVLPLDVMVDPREWAKYGDTPTDLSPLAQLGPALVADAHAAGVSAVDLTPALVAASPGAFLPDDYHLAPAGHAAVAAAVASVLAPAPAPAADQIRSLRGASVERLAHPTADLASSARGGNPLREAFQAPLRSLSPAAFGAPAGAGDVSRLRRRGPHAAAPPFAPALARAQPPEVPR